MFRNYVKTAYRSLLRNKSYAVINIAGLSAGIAACLLLFIVISYQLSYDKAQPNYSRIARIVTGNKNPDGSGYTAGVPFPAIEAVRADFPQLTTGALFSYWDSQVTVLGKNANVAVGKNFLETIVFFADPQWFHVFQYHWLAGSPAVLANPNVTVLTKAMAEKYFGNWQSAVGKFLKIDNLEITQVAGILDDMPHNTDFPLAVVCSFETVKEQAQFYSYNRNWNNTSSEFQLYTLIPPAVDINTINHQFQTSFSNKYYGNGGVKKRYSFLQPLSDIHFDNRFDIYSYAIITKPTLWTLSLIGAFILLMAVINFINLSTATAVRRSKEVGIRKVLGGNRLSLFWQMMGETAFIVAASLLLAVLLAVVCLLFVKSVAFPRADVSVFTGSSALFIVAVAIVVTLGAGFYPALVLSGFSPILALKNRITSANIGGISLRRGLVVLQFGISQVLIIGTLIAVSQMSFVHNADLGFNKDAVLVLNGSLDSTVHARYPAFKQALLQLPGVQYVTAGSDAPASGDEWSMNFAYNHGPDENWAVAVKFADEDYLRTFGIPLIAGRLYSASDTMNEVVVNETLLAKLRITHPSDAIGKQVQIGGKGTRWYTITGVVKDFKTASLRRETPPLLLAASLNDYTQMAVKLHSRNIAGTRAAVEATWNKFYPEYAIYTFFFGDQVNEFYRQEDQLALLYKIFAAIAIFISCLGLYGLVSFLTVQKTKEVGIRKVLGATTAHIMYLFSREFILLVGIAFLVAAPVAWYVMNNWLANFAYRISIGAGIFLLAIAVSLCIALATVAYKSFRAAIANPVKSLQTE